LAKADTFCPELQLRGPTCAGFGCDVVGVGVYTYVHDHCEVVVVEPVTVDVNVCTVPAITVAAVGDTVSMTVFAPDPPHPFWNIAPASASIAAVLIVRNFMNHISLVKSARPSLPRPLAKFLVPRLDGLNSFPRCPPRTCGSP
jgi:hypothetical protein